MGRGIALAAKQLHPKLPYILGMKIKETGNHVYYIDEYNLFTFPVKHNFWEKADINLIKRSCEELLWYVKFGNIQPLMTMFGEVEIDTSEIYLPKPGCNNGQLRWEDVEKVVEPILKEYPQVKVFEL